jgi:hypothetical protein
LAISLNSQKNWGQETKICIVNGSNHRCGLVGHYLSLVLGPVPGLLSGGHFIKQIKSKTKITFIKYNTEEVKIRMLPVKQTA